MHGSCCLLGGGGGGGRGGLEKREAKGGGRGEGGRAGKGCAGEVGCRGVKHDAQGESNARLIGGPPAVLRVDSLTLIHAPATRPLGAHPIGCSSSRRRGMPRCYRMPAASRLIPQAPHAHLHCGLALSQPASRAVSRFLLGFAISWSCLVMNSFSKATLGKLLRDGVERIWVFSERINTILN